MRYEIVITINDDYGTLERNISVPDEMPLLYAEVLKQAYDQIKDRATLKLKRRGLTSSKEEMESFLKSATIKDL